MSRNINNLPPHEVAYDVSPQNLDQLIQVVGALAHEAKAIGGGWGFSLAGVTSGTRIRMMNMAGVSDPDCLRIGATSTPLIPHPSAPHEFSGPLKKVLAGTPFGLVNQLLSPLTVLNQPGFRLLTFGGVMMVGGHGSGITQGNIASQVRSLDLIVVTAERKAKLVRIEPASNPITDSEQFEQQYPLGELILNDQLFRAAKVSFGSMGVLYSATIDTRPSYRLEEDRDLRSLWRDFDKIEAQVRDPAVNAVHLWVNPYQVGSDFKALQSTYRRSFDMQRNKRGWGIRQADSPIAVKALQVVVEHVPTLLPFALEWSLTTAQGDDVVMDSPEALDFGPPNALPVAAASCAIEASKIRPILAALLQHLKEEFGTNFVSSPIGLRWVKASDAYLAPQFDRDSVMLELPVLNGTPNQEDTLKSYVRFMVRNKCRPHWGQRLWLEPNELRYLYGDLAVDSFISARRVLDPLGIFDNPLTKMIGV